MEESRTHVLRSEALPISICCDAFQDMYARGDLLDVVIRVTDGHEEDAQNGLISVHSDVLM